MRNSKRIVFTTWDHTATHKKAVKKISRYAGKL